MEKTVLFEKENGVALITLNRPERRNALNQDLLKNLYNCIEAVASDIDIRAAVLTGAGSAFCSGLDLKAIATDNLIDPRGDGKLLSDVLGACDKPIIGAINGPAMTGGFELALNCDFLIASEQASFADTHVKMGIHPGWGMSQLLQNAVGQRMARQMSFTCQFITAQEALRAGLVNEVVAPERLVSRAKELAGHIAAMNPDMLQTMRKLIEYRDGASLDESLAHEGREFMKFFNKHWKK
ncbi:MAG TPA: enoyl-CoA hydratase [Spirochaetota bacterium]|nr:enoyl-CoA hydratase [Spirochaetota bacterium]HOD16466.1 enoyl-CoA hydratase [Spirochaetota bacterium]HPG50186.1 enoyl-CoA hydratase [Spirochaetota bacterium]HPN13093.1 enoyl-CoA hydratase [Spirochaetota bacterium]HQL83881.1 enoyl-CoA hydratase [Spirochaetota bacterium]